MKSVRVISIIVHCLSNRVHFFLGIKTVKGGVFRVAWLMTLMMRKMMVVPLD